MAFGCSNATIDGGRGTFSRGCDTRGGGEESFGAIVDKSFLCDDSDPRYNDPRDCHAFSFQGIWMRKPH